MDLSNWANLFMLTVTVLAATVAWRSLLAAGRATREADNLRGRLSALERAAPTEPTSKKAVFDVFVKRGVGRDRPYTFTLKNSGGGEAQDFGVLWNNELLSKAPVDASAQMPTTVAPGESVKLTMLPGFEEAKLRLVWCDESGEWQEQSFSYGSAQAVA